MDVNELVCESTICAGVLGRGDEYLLVRLDADFYVRQYAVQKAIERGLFYCGAFGWANGRMRVALESDPDTLKPMRLAVFAFAAMVGAPAPTAAPEANYGDTAGWLERLYSLPDTRA